MVNPPVSTPKLVFSLGLFFASIGWFNSIERRRQRIIEFLRDDSHETQSDDIGLRGSRAIKKTVSYWHGFLKCLQNPCDPMANPEGYIALCVAENKLVQESFAIRLMQPGTAMTAFSDSVVYCYNGFLGLPAVREAVAYFLESRFLMVNESVKTSIPPPAGHPSQTINPEHVALGAGCGSLLSHLFFCLANRGDVVLMPAPYYAGFDYDVKAVAGCVPYAVQMANPIFGPTPDDLEKAACSAKKKGLKVKMLLLTNPNDPLGVIYGSDVISNAIKWARSRKIHTIVDEVYALSIHKDEHLFRSVIKILNNELGKDVHFLWGLSKDFGASGFRIGVLYTQNNMLLQALANLNIFSGVSHPMQMIVAEILTDEPFVNSFLNESRSQLKWSYAICTRKLEEMVIPFIPAEAGLFVYVDFSSLLPTQSFAGEEMLSTFMQDVARVVMQPGQCQHDRKPGMFRICYAWVSADVLDIAMERLSYLVLQIRRNGLENLDPTSLKDVTKCGTHLSIKRTGSVNLADLSRRHLMD